MNNKRKFEVDKSKDNKLVNSKKLKEDVININNNSNSNNNNMNLKFEIPFWKVFRNKYLFSNIFSNFEENKRFSYQYLFNIDHLFERYNNAIEILFDKLKSGNYQLIKSTDDMKFVLGQLTAKDNQFNRSLLNLIFKIYSTPESFNNNGIYKTSSIIKFDNTKKWIQSMIYLSNYVVLDQYINYFKIERDKIKECHSIYQQDYPIKKKVFKFLNYLILNGLIKFSDVQDRIKIFDYEFVHGRITLGKLISKFKTITAFLNNHVYQYENNKINNLISELNQIDKTQFKTEGLLNSNVYNLLKSNSSTDLKYYYINNSSNKISLKDIIKKYYKFFYLLRNGEEDLDVYISEYDGNEILEVYKHKSIIYYLHFKSINKVFKVIDKINNRVSSINEEDCEKCPINPIRFFNILFDITYKNNKHDQIELISNMSEYYGNAQFTFSIFQSNNVEIIDFYLKNYFSELTQNDVNTLKSYGFPLSKTKEMVEYYFQNYGDELINDFKYKKDYQSFQLNPEMFDYFESLVKSSGKKIIINPLSGTFEWYKYIPFFNNAILKPSIYSFMRESGDNHGIKFSPHKSDFKNDKSIIYFLSNIIIDSFLSIPDYCRPSLTILKFLFQGISKEIIQKNINKVLKLGKSILSTDIHLETLLSYDEKDSDNSNYNENYSNGGNNTVFIIGKPKKLKFSISFKQLLNFLVSLDRVDDILYLFFQIPTLINETFSHSIFDDLPNYSIEQICNNYFTKVIDSNITTSPYGGLVDLVLSLLSVAVERGCDVLFLKNIISNDFNNITKIDKFSKLLNSNIELNCIDRNYLKYPTKEFSNDIASILFHKNNFQLFYLFIKSINLPTELIDSFKKSFNDRSYNKL